jgi:hypothetical protein
VKPKAPKHIMILGYKFTVVLATDFDTETWGESDALARSIRVCATKNKTQAQVDMTLLHEVLHMILSVSGVSNLLNNQLEEGLVVSLENGLAPLVKLR